MLALLSKQKLFVNFNFLISFNTTLGSKKSLINVFQDGVCHSKMAMVINDRLKAWEDKDQPRVHVVLTFILIMLLRKRY